MLVETGGLDKNLKIVCILNQKNIKKPRLNKIGPGREEGDYSTIISPPPLHEHAAPG